MKKPKKSLNVNLVMAYGNEAGAVNHSCHGTGDVNYWCES